MNYVDELRAPPKARAFVGGIERLSASIKTCRTRPLQITEVRGDHTHTIFRSGLEQMLPKRIELVHRPGCPVCALPMARDGWPGVLVRTTFGSSRMVDMLIGEQLPRIC